MFPRVDRPVHPARAWADALRRGLDALVAFATLRGAETSSERGDEDVEAASMPPAARPQLGAGEPIRRPAGRGAPAGMAGRGFGGAGHAIHPHRHAITAPARQRRPGAVRPQPQPCLTPLATRRARRPGVSARGAR